MIFIFNNFQSLEVWYPHSGPSASFPALLKRTFLLFGQPAFSWPQGAIIELSWTEWIPSQIPLQCRCVSAAGAALFSSMYIICLQPQQNFGRNLSQTQYCLISGVGPRCNAWENVEMYKSVGKQFQRFRGFWCFAVKEIWWKANCRNSLGKKVPHWLLEDCRAGKCRILSGCQSGC